MSIYQRIVGSKDLSLYAGGFWTFFNGNEACGDGVDCQTDAVRIENSTDVDYFGVGVNHVKNLVVVDGEAVIGSAENRGGWYANAAAYLLGS